MIESGDRHMVSKKYSMLLLVLTVVPLLGGNHYFINGKSVNEAQYKYADSLVNDYNTWLEQECMKNARYKQLQDDMRELLLQRWGLGDNDHVDKYSFNVLISEKEAIKDQLAKSAQGREKDPNMFLAYCGNNSSSRRGSYNYTYDHSHDEAFMQSIENMYDGSLTTNLLIAGSFIIGSIAIAKIAYVIIKRLKEKRKSPKQRTPQKLQQSFAQSV